MKIEVKCFSRINFVIAAMDAFQRITVQGTVSSEDHVRYVRKNIQLVYMDSNLRKKVQNKTVKMVTISRPQPHAQVFNP